MLVRKLSILNVKRSRKKTEWVLSIWRDCSHFPFYSGPLLFLKGFALLHFKKNTVLKKAE